MQSGIDRRIYFDLETQGLAAGHRIFLSGMLWWESSAGRDGLVLAQDVALDIVDEGRLIRRLVEHLERFETIVTYNGTSFDLPHLEKRMHYHGISWTRGRPGLSDLLIRARREHGAELENCKLSTLEQEILGKRRSGKDVSGAQVPLRFLDYLETGDPRCIDPIVYHNRIDLTSLVALDATLAGGPEASPPGDPPGPGG